MTAPNLGLVDPTSSSKFSILVEGVPKSGKTHFASTMPDPTFLVADHNTKGHEAAGLRHVHVRDWAFWNGTVRPAMTARLYPGKTIVLDSLSSLIRKLELSFGGPTGTGPSNKHEWATVKSSIVKILDDLDSLRRPKRLNDGSTHPGYHVCVLVHQKAVVGDDGKLIEYLPDISTRVDRSLGGTYDAHFNTETKTIVGASGPETKFWIRSVPETPKHRAGDNLGGPGKKYNALPAKLENDFRALLKAWGAEGEVEW